jgi:hypothetical protein
LFDELLSLVDSSRREREHRLDAADLPEVDGLPELVRDPRCSREICVRRLDVAELYLCVNADDVSIGGAFLVADPLRQLAELGPEREAFF